MCTRDLPRPAPTPQAEQGLGAHETPYDHEQKEIKDSHQSVFWMGSPKLMMTIMQLCLIVNAMLLGVFIVVFLSHVFPAVFAWRALHGWPPIVLLPLALAGLLPFVLTLILAETAVSMYVIVTSVVQLGLEH